MSRPEANGVRSVAVVGRDTALWVTALGLKRALSRIGVSVVAVELPTALGPADVHSALPSLANLHAVLGLPEEALYASCGALPSLGQQFVGWSQADFIHGYDVSRPAINDVDFVQFWSLARRNGMPVAYEDFSLAAVAAKQGRMPTGRAGEAGEPPAPGYHVNARAYAGLLRQGCVAGGVELRATPGVTVERDGERIVAVTLADGERIEADLFIDASGTERALIGDAGFARWEAFPATHLLTGATAPIEPMPSHARIVAVPGGWIGLFPVQGVTALTGHILGGDQESVTQALSVAGVTSARDLVVRPFVTGARERSWIGNVIAVGDAAASIERLDAAEIQLLQVALSNLIALWPVDRTVMPEARDFDRLMASHVAAIRDFQQAHYTLSTRPEPLWQRARGVPPSPELAARLALFGARGVLAHRDDETFQPQSWAAMLIGHGIVPAESDPAVDRTPPDEAIGKIQQLLHLIAADVRAMPSMAEFLRR